MRITRTIAISFSDLFHHAFRSFLTALGVVFGVGAVVAMMAITEGAKQESLNRIKALGIDNIVVRSIKPTSGKGVKQSSNRWTPVEYGIKTRDLAHISKLFKNIQEVVPVREIRESIAINGEISDIHAFGTTAEFFKMSRTVNADPRGRVFTDDDDENSRLVCVVGRRAARKLFSFRDPLNKTVRIGPSSFRVIGVFDNPQSTRMLGGYDLNNQIFLPLGTANAVYSTTSRKVSAGSTEVVTVEADFIYVRVRKVDLIENTAARLRAYLKETHKQEDYEVQVPYELLEQSKAQQRIYTIVMASIASISLLVGGIGIMNIMMANIFERTREIGTRRALGARKRDILVQFLVESMLLTAIGGLIGVGVGYGLAHLVQIYSQEIKTIVTGSSVAVSLGVSVMVGVIFGTYPAWKAANMDPINALRTE